MTTHHALSLLSFSAVVFFASASEAAPTENMPASSCKARYGSISVRSDGEIENPSASSWAVVVCPVRRPIGAPSTSTSTSLAAKVFMVDRSSSFNGWCQARSKNPAGSNRYSSAVYSSGSSSTYQTLNLPTLTDTATWSHFFIECRLPPADSGLRSRLQMVRSIQ